MPNLTEPELKILAAYEKHMDRYTGNKPERSKTMKRKRTNAINRIIATILCTAILIAGISFDGTVDASAAAKTENFVNGKTINMKPGQTKQFLLTDNTGKDIVEKYKWSSSDKNIISVDSDFIDENTDYTLCIEITAINKGTATVTGTSKYGYASITMTVEVSQPAATTKQKACKHTWKTTMKATCDRTGIKTCKKCKLQKQISKTTHKYINVTTQVTETDGYYHVYQCTGCECPNMECINTGKCPTLCNFKTKVKYDKNDKIAPDSDFKSEDEAYRYLWSKHLNPKNKDHNTDRHGAWTDYYVDINPHSVTKTIKICKYCGTQK